MHRKSPCTNSGSRLSPRFLDHKLYREHLGPKKTSYYREIEPESHRSVKRKPFSTRPMSDKTALGVHEYEDAKNPTSKSAQRYGREMVNFKRSLKLSQLQTFSGLVPQTLRTCTESSKHLPTGDNSEMLNWYADQERETVSAPLESGAGFLVSEYFQGNMGLNIDRGEAYRNWGLWRSRVHVGTTKHSYAYKQNEGTKEHSTPTQNTDMFIQDCRRTMETRQTPETTRNDQALQDDYGLSRRSRVAKHDVRRKTATIGPQHSSLSRQNKQPRMYVTPQNTIEKVKGGPETARRTQDAVGLQDLEAIPINAKAPRHTEKQQPTDRNPPKHSETESNIETQQYAGELRSTGFLHLYTDTQCHTESHQLALGARWHEDIARPSAANWDKSPTQADRRRLVPETSSTTPRRKRARLHTNASKTEAENIWTETVRICFPNLHNRSYFLPACVFNRTSSETAEFAGEKTTVPNPSTQLSDVRENEAENRVMQTFQQTFQHSQNPMVIVFNVIFDNYLNNTHYSTCHEDKTMLPQLEIHGRGLKEEASASAGRHSQTRTALQTKGTDTRVHQGNERPQGQKDKSLKVQMQESKIVQGTKSFAEASRRGQVNALFQRPRDLSPELQRGKFDMIFINKKHGLIICDIKTVGDTFHVQGQAMTEEKEHEIIRDKVTKALKQLDKEEKVLKYLTSDKDDRLKIRTVLILPNIKRNVMLKVLGEDRQLEQDFCCRFGSDNTEAALSLCLFAEDFPPIGLAWETDDDVIKRLQKTWWKGLTDGDDGNAMDDDVYESIVARFCGPATNLHACTVFQPRADVTTLRDAVLETAACFQLPTLTREQLEILEKTRDAKVYVTGPPGTGKSLMLKLKAMQWAKQGHDVFIVSLWQSSETASRVLFEQIQESLLMPRQRNKVQLITGKNSNFAAILTTIKNHLQKLSDLHKGSTIFVHEVFNQSQIDLDVEMHEFSKTETAAGNGEDLEADGELEETAECDKETMHNEPERCGESHKDDRPVKKRQAPNVKETGRTDISSPIYLILDEVPWMLDEFAEYLERTYRGKVHLWAASSYSGSRPEFFKEVKLTQSLRCPPVVTREIEKGPAYSTRAMYHYATGDSAVLSSLPPSTDGPPVKRIRHVHLDKDVWDCEECGVAVGQFLREDLLIGKPDIMSKNTSQRRLSFRDVLVSGYVTFPATQNPPRKSAAEPMDVEIDNDPASSESYFLRGLKKSGVPYDIFRKEDSGKLACPTEDKVQVAEADSVQGLERPVVILIGTNDMSATYPRYVDPWCDVIGTCVAQLVVVTPTHSFNSQLNLG